MGRAPCCDKANVKKGPWSPEEDAKLKHFIQTNGTGGNWITLPSKAGLRRCGKSCRLRWINYLRPDIKHGSFTEEEEKLIIELHGKVGSRWSLIAAQLQGRTDNDIKNYWNTRLKKKLAEKGMNSSLSHQQQQHRSYHHMRSAAPMFISLSQPDAIRQSQMSMKDGLIDRQTAQYLEQRRYNATQLAIQQSRPASLFTQGQHLEQWQQQPQSMPFVKSELPPDVSDPERFKRIQSELLDIISPEVSDAMTSTQSIDILHQQSPNSPCSNWSSDRSYGGQLEDSQGYSDTFSSICNSYGDPPPLVDAQPLTTPLLPLTTVLSSLQQQQQLPNTASSIQKEDSASATSITSPGRFGSLYGELTTFSDQTSYLSDTLTSPIDRFLGVKEEVCNDFLSSDLISSPNSRGFLPSRAWLNPSLRCGDGLSAAHQAQMLSSQSVDALSEPLGFIFSNPKYVSI